MYTYIRQHWLLILFLLIGTFFRFYNLNWSSPYYFHPDERQNVAYPILQSNSPFMLDQKKFDTGSFPLIIIKLTHFTSVFLFSSLKTMNQVALVILISRIYSAIFSLLILFLLFLFCKKIFGLQKAYLTVAFATFSTGFIQFSHFGTIELWEALFFLIFFFFCYQISKYAKWQTGIICGFILGISMASKTLTAIVIPAIFFSFLIYFTREYHKKIILKSIRKVFIAVILFGITSEVIFFIISPQILYNFKAFYNDIHYESQVSLGTLHVFYTQEFFNTIPVLFQFLHVYPFLLNPLITFLFILSFLFVLYIGIKKKKFSYLLVIAFYLLIFLSQAFFFAKWTRYMVPTLPFMYLIIGTGIDDLLSFIGNWKFKSAKMLSYFLVTFPLVISFIFALSFFITVYMQPDTRIVVRAWAKNNIPNYAKILTEPYDIGIIPFNREFSYISFFDFYNLDGNTVGELAGSLVQSDYIILPSQRLLKSRLTNKSDFPQGYLFYKKLINKQLGFSKIYETPCDLLCNIIYLGNPVFAFEETANVFDRPTVFIFKKVRTLSANEYTAMLQ